MLIHFHDAIAWLAQIAMFLVLGKATPLAARPPSPLSYDPVDNTSDIGMQEFVIAETSPVVGKQLIDVDLPETALILLVFRGDEHIVPTGSTILEADDRALILAPEPIHPAIRTVLDDPSASGNPAI